MAPGGGLRTLEADGGSAEQRLLRLQKSALSRAQVVVKQRRFSKTLRLPQPAAALDRMAGCIEPLQGPCLSLERQLVAVSASSPAAPEAAEELCWRELSCCFRRRV